MLHKYLRAVGFSKARTRQDLNNIINIAVRDANIEKWRHEKSLERTKERRPDLYEKYVATHEKL